MISSILSNKSVFRILLLYSYGKGAGYTWSNLREYTFLQNKSLRIALDILEFQKIILRENKIYKLNFSSEYTSLVLNLIEEEKKLLNYPNYELYIALISMMEVIQRKDAVGEVYLFGSHAKKKATTNSDIDIAIISQDLNLDFTKETYELEEKYGYKFEFHIHRFSDDLLSKEIKHHGVKLL